jgi:hypothetical protein
MSLITINGATADSHMQVSREDLCYIFYAVRSSMVNNRPKPGIFKEIAYKLSYDSNTIWIQWKKMKKKLAILLNNQPEEDHIGIIAAGSHILFVTDSTIRSRHAEMCTSGEPMADSDVDIGDDEADEILATLRGTVNNNDLYNIDNCSDNTTK